MDTSSVDTTDVAPLPVLVIDRFDEWTNAAGGTARYSGCVVDVR